MIYVEEEYRAEVADEVSKLGRYLSFLSHSTNDKAYEVLGYAIAALVDEMTRSGKDGFRATLAAIAAVEAAAEECRFVLLTTAHLGDAERNGEVFACCAKDRMEDQA